MLTPSSTQGQSIGLDVCQMHAEQVEKKIGRQHFEMCLLIYLIQKALAVDKRNVLIGNNLDTIFNHFGKKYYGITSLLSAEVYVASDESVIKYMWTYFLNRMKSIKLNEFYFVLRQSYILGKSCRRLEQACRSGPASQVLCCCFVALEV